MATNRKSDVQDSQQSLPIIEHQKPILRRIRANRITCIHGETGCGKSTMVPQFILDYLLNKKKKRQRSKMPVILDNEANIIITQPRRVAAVSLAKRVANQRQELVGETVGYRIGGDSKVSDVTKITYVTTGLLLQMLANNPECFKKFSHIILDEIHERQIDSDLLSLIVKLLSNNKDREYHNTKIIIMSATLEGELFSKYFDDKLNLGGPDTDSEDEFEKEEDEDEEYQEAKDFDEEKDKPNNDLIFVGAKRFHVEEVYLDDLVKKDQYKSILQAEDIQNACKALAKFNMQKPRRPGKFSSDHLIRANYDNLSLLCNDMDNLGLKLNYMQKGMASKYGMKPDISEGFHDICFNLIMKFMAPGESILVFLPGIKEIEYLHDWLAEEEKYPHYSSCLFRLYTLHSRIMKEEQESIADLVPPGECAHIILATNIAESSLTLPNVRYVIDYGLRRHMIYVSDRRMECLMKTWVSQASADQRKGRTGRIFEGTVIRLYSRYFYEHVMMKYDPPEMQLAALDRLFLQVKQLGPKVAPGKRPSQLLKMSISPPEVSDIHEAVLNLADAGALTAANEHAEMTMMANLVLNLPLDLNLCRLIFYGTLFNCVTDVVIMAAGLSMNQDVLSLPTKQLKQQNFVDSLRWSFDTRKKFDKGEYSEPIMLLHMFREWLSVRISIQQKHDKWEKEKQSKQHQDYKKDRFKSSALEHAKHVFRKNNAVSMERLSEMEDNVIGICSRLSKLVLPESESGQKLKGLVEAIKLGALSPPEKNSNETTQIGATGGLKTQHKNQKGAGNHDLDLWMFTEDMVILKYVLAASFTPYVLHGTSNGMVATTKKGISNKVEITKNELSKEGFDLECSVVIHDAPAVLQKNDVKCEEVLSLMLPKDSKVKHKCMKDGRIFVEFIQNPNQPQHVIQDVAWTVHAANQYSEGRDKFPCPGLMDDQSQGRRRRGPAMFGQPKHPCKINWEYLTDAQEPSVIIQGTPKGWRNPIGFACEMRKDFTHYAVAAEIQGSEKKEYIQIDGVTVLPSECHGRLAVMAILTFLPGRRALSITVCQDKDDVDYVKRFNVFNHDISLDLHYPLTLQLLCLMNNIRAEISAALRLDIEDDFIPDVNLQPLLHRLIHCIRESDKHPIEKPELRKKNKKNIFHPYSLNSSLSESEDSLASSDSEESNSPEMTEEEIPEDFVYLKEFKPEDWFPHATQSDYGAIMETEKAHTDHLIHPKQQPPPGPAQQQDPLYEDEWD